MIKNLFIVFIGALLGGIVSVSAYKWMESKENRYTSSTSPVAINRVSYKETRADSIQHMFSIGFGEAAKRSLEEVVHIRASITGRSGSDPVGDFFGNQEGNPFDGDSRQQGLAQQATGSGVIIRRDGYIITNNHVVEGASQLEVSLHNKRVYQAKVVGTDPSTDLALIKIQENNLPAARFANSDQVQVGDWVLAVGNPFDLASTVTAGIISAKARSIHILEDNSAIESFLQTDAAINPGNSGGALVNLKGELVGINTAIATPTGTYAGYAFAVPSNLAAKVVEDIIRFGKVQRAYLGVMVQELDWNLAQDLNLDVSQGVLVSQVSPRGAARRAGLQSKDVIVAINNRQVQTSADLLETVARQRPGDQITLTINRSGKQSRIPIKLSSSTGE
jgi:serine protease Do